MVVLPEFSNDINTLRITMWGNTTAQNATDAGTMTLGYISDVYDPTTFVAVTTIPATAFGRVGNDSPHADFIGPYDFSEVTPQDGLRIALRLTDVATSATGSSTSWNLDDIIVSLISDVEVEDHELTKGISLMPNPADHYIELSINSTVEVKEAVVFNAFGQMIQTVQLTDNHARIDLSNMASGMYFVRVSGDTATATNKFIKK